MDCTHFQTEISARLDGEPTTVDDRVIAAHVASCAACRSFERDAGALHRSTRLVPAPTMPDLTPRVLAAIGEHERAASPSTALRVGLAVIAIVQIAIAVPALFLGEDAGLPVHTARHLGSFAVALGVGFLFAAWKPSRVSGLFPVAAALVACLLATSFVDVAAGRATAGDELTHATELVGLCALWLISRTDPAWRASGGAPA